MARTAARHAHALVVEVPGWWRTRMILERAVLARGWRLAHSPAGADLLVVCGEPGPRLAQAVDLVWHQMPGPRVRVEALGHHGATVLLDEAQTRLLDTAHHRHDALHRPGVADLLALQADGDGEEHEEHGGHSDHDEHKDSGHDDHDHGGHGGHGGHDDHDHGGHGDHGGHDHGDHGGHDHGDMDMSPSGIPLAGGGEDRDGLEMDVLTVRLGPVLAHWPAGLVLHCPLQGDVLTQARAELLDATGDHEDGPEGPVCRLDRIASLLALAGWDDAAGEARRLRDAALDADGESSGASLERLQRKVRRSRTLRWSLRGLRPLTEEDVRRHGLPAEAVGDTYDRLIRMLDRAAAGPGDRGHEDGAARQDVHHTLSTDQLAHLVTGLDLAAARLVVASLDVHELQAGHAQHEMAHG